MVGKIIFANYTDIITNLPKQGYFLVVYDESKDNGGTNLTCLKITSQLDKTNAYSIPISHDNLNKISMLQCNKIHTINNSNVIKSIGGVNDNYMKRVVNTLNKFLIEINRQRDKRAQLFAKVGRHD